MSPAEPPSDAVERRRRVRRPRPTSASERSAEERLTQRLAAQWSMMREERRPVASAPAPVIGGPSNLSPAKVPWGVDLASAWAWRFLVIVAAGYLIVRALGFLQEVTVPLAVALLISALVSPLVRALQRAGLPKGLSSLLVVIFTLAVIGSLLTLAGQQIASGANDLASSTASGLGEIRTWLQNGPLHASDSQINNYIQKAQDGITKQVAEGKLATRLTEVGSAVSHVFAGLFIVLFATYFFLADGDRIWAFLVRIAPRAARHQVDSSGRVAWVSLTQFVRATVIVAATDAAGIMIGAAILQVPFVLAIGVLVFLGAFVPLVGAFVAGTVAVLVALVTQGPVVAIIMLGVVVGVQQLEAHVLQPFLMGRWVSLHPLGVIIAIAVGILVAGIVGALVAVPLTAVVNAVVEHLASSTAPGGDPVDELQQDYEEQAAGDALTDVDD